MKFVKGDVIASLIITVVNILGGLAIGVGQQGMPVVDALKRYGLLTIGDGLVSQIPALVLSTAAGVLVTRVASEEPDTPLGEELAGQLFGMPKALRVAGGLRRCCLALVPGLPARRRSSSSRASSSSSRARATAQIAARRQRDATEPPTPRPRRRAATRTAFVPMVVPWSIEVSEDLATLLDDETRGGRARRAGASRAPRRFRERLFAELGVPLPAPRVRVVDGLPAAARRRVALRGAGARRCPFPTELDDAQAVSHRRATSAAELLRARAPRTSSASPRRSACSTSSSSSRPAIVRNVVPKPVSLTLLADVLRRLVEERVSASAICARSSRRSRASRRPRRIR